jgi:hypothetical protein
VSDFFRPLGFQAVAQVIRLGETPHQCDLWSREPGADRMNPQWLFISVRRPSTSEWIGAFEKSGIGHPAECYACALPNDAILVVAAGRGYAMKLDPLATVSRVPSYPVLGVMRVGAQPLLVVWSFTDLAVYGHGGLLWESIRFATDDMNVTHCASGVIHGTCWHVGDEGVSAFAFEAASAAEMDGAAVALQARWGAPRVVSRGVPGGARDPLSPTSLGELLPFGAARP